MAVVSQEALIAIASAREPGLVRVIDHILEHPHREIVVDTPLVPLEDLTEPETESFLDLITSPGMMSPAKEPPIHFNYMGRKFQFTHVFDSRPRVTFDTYPNRYVRYFLLRYRDALARTSEEMIPEASELARRIDGTLSSSFLREMSPLHHVSSVHNVLRKDPNYREILRANITLGRLMSEAWRAS